MRIAIGCDPNATPLKKELIKLVEQLGHDVEDYGSNDPIYANTAIGLAEDVSKGTCDKGILLCGTGIGVSIAANKVPGAYVALVNNVYQAQRAVLSNNANIIALGAQVTGVELAKCLVETFLANEFDQNSRSAPKVKRIVDYERALNHDK